MAFDLTALAALPGTADPGAIGRAAALALAVSLVVAVLQEVLRGVVWSVFNVVATLFAFVAGSLRTLIDFLSAAIAEGLQGLSQEGGDRGGSGGENDCGGGDAPPWVGWYVIGPLLYFVLTTIFVLSDLTVAVLIFEAMGLTLGVGVGARWRIPIPLDGAMGVLFVALAVFWGILLFDLLGLTPFSYIWSGLSDRHRRRFLIWVVACLGVTLVAGLMMGVWSQAQLRGGLPEPWNTLVPWLIRGSLVALLLSATALSGKPLGSAVTALWIAVLLVVRTVGHVCLVVVRLVLVLCRELVHVPLAVVALVAFVAHRVWNWAAGFAWAERLHIGRLTVTPLPALGSDGAGAPPAPPLAGVDSAGRAAL